MLITNEADNGKSSSDDARKGVRILAEEWYLQRTKLTGRLSQVASDHRALHVYNVCMMKTHSGTLHQDTPQTRTLINYETAQDLTIGIQSMYSSV